VETRQRERKGQKKTFTKNSEGDGTVEARINPMELQKIEKKARV